MKFIQKPFFALVVLLLGIATLGSGQESGSQIQTEIQRLRAILKENPSGPNSDFAGVNSSIDDLLRAAEESVKHKQPYLALEKLGQATDLVRGLEAQRNNAEVLKNGLPAFESQWGQASLRLTALDKQAHDHDWQGIPVAVRALAESAQGKAIPLLEGGRGFATSTKPQDGLFYVGQAKGEAEFAAFCSSLKLQSTRTPLPLRSFLPELRALQQKTNEAFRPPRSIDLHSRFIALNSTIKLAQELDSSQFYAGALYEYLEAIRHFAMLDAAIPDKKQKTELKKLVAKQQSKLSDSQQDDSIAELFMQRAGSQIEHADGSAPTEDEWRSTQVIITAVLPAYFAALKPATPAQRASGKTVNLTLVRWPYT